MTINTVVTLSPHADVILAECLSARYDEAVAIAKAKYYYERVDGNARAAQVFNETTGATEPQDRLSAAYIDKLPSVNIFFPLYYFRHAAMTPQEMCRFGVLSEINTYLKRIVPDAVKRAKSIGTYVRETKNVDPLVVEKKMEDDESQERMLNNDSEEVLGYAKFEESGLFRIRCLNKLFVFKRGNQRLKLVGVEHGDVVFDPVLTYDELGSN